MDIFLSCARKVTVSAVAAMIGVAILHAPISAPASAQSAKDKVKLTIDPGVVVPNLVGSPADCVRFGDFIYRFARRDPTGNRIVATDPPAGSVAAKNSTVTVYLGTFSDPPYVQCAPPKTQTVSDTQRVPGFHHLHLNSVDPEAAIEFYVRHFPVTSRATWAGMSALTSPKNALILFNRVEKPPSSDPLATAYWYFGWHGPDVRRRLQADNPQPDIKLVPQYYSDGTSTFFPRGYGYLLGPDNALVEVADWPSYDPPRGEYLQRIRMFHDNPICAQLWYYRHLNAPMPYAFWFHFQGTERNCALPRGAQRVWPALQREGLFDTPRGGTGFGDVNVTWYVRQSNTPLESTRGHVVDHIALSVGNLDAWIAKLKNEGVNFLEEKHSLGNTQAVMIEGPSREAIELVEVDPSELPNPNREPAGFIGGAVP